MCDVAKHIIDSVCDDLVIYARPYGSVAGMGNHVASSVFMINRHIAPNQIYNGRLYTHWMAFSNDERLW